MIIKLISGSASLASIPFMVRMQQNAVPSISDAAIIIGFFLAISTALTALITAVNSYRGSKTVTDQIDRMNAEIEKMNARVKTVETELERADSALAYISSALGVQHPAEVQYALAIRRGDEEMPVGNDKRDGRDSDHKLRGGKRH